MLSWRAGRPAGSRRLACLACLGGAQLEGTSRQGPVTSHRSQSWERPPASVRFPDRTPASRGIPAAGPAVARPVIATPQAYWEAPGSTPSEARRCSRHWAASKPASGRTWPPASTSRLMMPVHSSGSGLGRGRGPAGACQTGASRVSAFAACRPGTVLDEPVHGAYTGDVLTAREQPARAGGTGQGGAVLAQGPRA